MQELWFDTHLWIVFLMPFLGLLAAGISKRKDPVIEGKRVLRHDLAARLAHWSHAIGTTVLLVSGIILGLRFTPAFVNTSADTAFWINAHFLFVLLFLFGTFYWFGNTIISRHRLREHLPTKNALSYTIQHYGSLLGIKKYKIPPEEKYFESERVAFIMAVVVTVAVLLTGLFKALAHAVNIPAGFMNAMTWIHDIGCVLMLLFFVAHVFMAAIAPFSWKTLRSMFTGYVSLDHAKHEHAGWVEELTEKDKTDKPEEK